MENFNEKLVDLVQSKILHDLSKVDLVTVSYGDRIELPGGLLNEVYQSMDISIIKARLKENLENEMADKIANKMITEFAGDIKQIMSNRELREDLRHYARERIKEIADRATEVTQ